MSDNNNKYYCNNFKPNSCECYIECLSTKEKNTNSQTNSFTADSVSPFITPLILLILLLAYKNNITSILERSLPNVKKVSFGSFSLELEKSSRANLSLSDNKNDLRNTGEGTNVKDSYKDDFIALFKNSTTADYAVIDLGNGKDWLVSRIYILAILLKEVHNISTFVFLESNTLTRKKYVGTANTEHIRNHFGMRYQWLEEAYRRACAPNPTFPNNIFTSHGRLLPDFAVDILGQYLSEIQIPYQANSEEGEEVKSFVPLKASESDNIPKVIEKTSWINASMLENILGNDLSTSSFTTKELRSLSETEKLKLLLSENEKYIGITDNNNCFKYLIEQKNLLTSISEDYLRNIK